MQKRQQASGRYEQESSLQVAGNNCPFVISTCVNTSGALCPHTSVDFISSGRGRLLRDEEE